MILTETLIDFLQEIIDFPDYKLSTSALQQQIQHLLFLVNITDCCSDLDNVIEEHKQLLVGYLFIPNNKYLTITFFQAVIKTGDISWDNVDYLCQWQSQILNNVKFSEELNSNNTLDVDYSEQIKKDPEDVKPNEIEEELIDPIEDGEVEDETADNLVSISIKSSGKRARSCYKSSVHDHFDKIKIINKETKKILEGSMCKYCQSKFTGRISTNLKDHINRKHPEVFDKVQSK